MLRQPFSNLQNMGAHGIVRVFRRKGTRFLEKKPKKLSFDKRSLLFWGAIRSDGQKMLDNCSIRLTAAEFLETENTTNKCTIRTLFSTINATVHKPKIIVNFSQEKEWRALDWLACSPDLDPIQNLWAVVKQQLRKQSFFEKFRKSVAKVDRN